MLSETWGFVLYPIVLVLEPSRLYLGYTGNLHERVCCDRLPGSGLAPTFPTGARLVPTAFAPLSRPGRCRG